MRRKLAVMLALCVAAGTISNPVGTDTVRAAEVREAGTVENGQTERDDFVYEELANGDLKITEYKGSGTEAVIPSAIGGKAVTMIGNAAFSSCNELTSVTIPASVTNIGEGAGYTEYDVFSECGGLKEIIVDDGNVWYSSQDGILYDKDKTQLVLCPAGKEDGVAIVEGVTGIKHGRNEQAGRYSVASAFYGCSIISVRIPASFVDFIGSEYGMWVAPYHIFSNCSYLEEIIVDDDNAAYSSQDGMLYNKDKQELLICPAGKIGSVTIPASVTRIGSHNYSSGTCYEMFGYCGNLTEINVDINNMAYSSQDGILYNKGKTELIRCPLGKEGSVLIPDGVTAISRYSFGGCTGLTEITMSEGVTSLAEGAFSGCNSLADITISDGVEVIGDYAFQECSRLTSITVPKTVTQIGHRYYEESDGTYLSFVNCSSLEEIIVDSNNRVYSSRDGVLYNKDMTYLLLCPAGKKGSMTIPARITSIADRAFQNCRNLTEIVANTNNSRYRSYDGVLYQYGAGEDGDIVSLLVCPSGKAGAVRIPAEVNYVRFNSFIYCDNITEFLVDQDNRRYSSQDGILYEIRSRSQLSLIQCPAKKEGDIVIPDATSSIYATAFAGCRNLKSVTVPERLSLPEDVFVDCSKDLHLYCVKGSKAEIYAVEHGISYTTTRKKFCGIDAYGVDGIKVGDAPFQLEAYAWIYDKDGYEDYIDTVLFYESSNDSVVSVSPNGLVTIVGAGTAQVTITTLETEDYEAAREVITFTVNPKSGESQNPDNNQDPSAGSGPQNPEIKKEQTITASDITKTYGAKPFPVGATTDGGGKLSYAVKNPKVATVDGAGKVTVKGCGMTEITITAAENGEYQAAVKTVTLTVAPKKLSVTSAKSQKAKTLTVKWKKDKTASGYIIECSTDKKFKKNVKTVTVKKNKTVSKKIPKLKGGKKYYVRACAYAEAGGAKIKGAYGKAKKAVKVKK